MTGVCLTDDDIGVNRSVSRSRQASCGKIGLLHATPTAPPDRPGKDEGANPRHSVAQDLERLLKIVERNTERISRLEDVFALQVQQREEVTRELKELRAYIRRRRP